MIEGLSYKKKNQFLLFGTIGFGLLIYVIAIKKTITIYDSTSKESQSIEKNASFHEEYIANKKKLAQLIILSEGANANDSVSFQDEWIELVSADESRGVQLIALPSFHHQSNDVNAKNDQLKLSGPFKSLLQLLYSYESKKKITNIKSVQMMTNKQNFDKQNEGENILIIH